MLLSSQSNTSQQGQKNSTRSKVERLAQRRRVRRRARRGSSWSKTFIILCVGIAEIAIYFLYQWGYFYSISVVLEAYLVDAVVDPIVNILFGSDGTKSVKIVTDHETMDMAATLDRTSKALGYPDHPFDPLQIPERDDSKFYHYSSKEEMGVNYTLQVLQNMGVNRSELVERNLLSEIPPWWQVLDNYGNEPIILGLERCEAFRERVHRRHVAPAGMFSTGTNLLQQMLFDNCLPPLKGQRQRIFNLWQVPWGKHNPPSARLNHIAVHLEFQNQSAVLPVVTVRHPYTWLYALCTHPYSLDWTHRPEYCDRSLFLKFPVKAHLASLRHATITNDTTGTKRSREDNAIYDSLMHVWRDWNLEYFQQEDYPMLIVRFEDLVFRPKQVVEQVCHCVGGTLGSERKESEPFWYLQESANLGQGHGKHRSDLVSAVIRYGQPLELYHHMFSQLDWSIIRDVLSHDQGLTRALGYKL